MEPREGDLVTENLRLTRLLGRGGMGSVWIAKHNSLDVDVAVKFVTKELLSGGDPMVIERFRREAQLAAKIESQHVVRIFDHGLTKGDGAPYIVMELMRGESLASRLARLQRLALGDAARIVSEIANGLEAAHEMGVIHRDIKPHNVFLARGREGKEIAKILDFGIAKTTNPGEEVHQAVKTSTGVLIGTPQYMSPEQLMRAGAPDAGADLWALSVVAYELVTGKLPFAGETLAATLIAITRAEITPPSHTVPEAPEGLDTFFGRAFAVDTARRYGNAKALAEAFVEAAGGIEPSSIVPSDAPTKEGPALAVDLTTEQFLAADTAAREKAAKAGAEFAATEIASPTPGEGAGHNTGTATSLDVPRSGAADDASPTQESEPAEFPREKSPSIELPAATMKSRVPWIAAAVIAIAAGSTFVATQKDNRVAGPSPIASASPTTAEPATTSPGPTSTTAAVSAKPEVMPFKRQAVKDGRLADEVWVGDFWVERDVKDVGLDFLSAETRCRSRSLALCTNAQFTRACETYPELGTATTFTATSEAGGLVVRGGADCKARSTVLPDDADSNRSLLCCTRAIALGGDVKRFGVPRNAASQVLMYESNLNQQKGAALVKRTAGTIRFFEQPLSGEKLANTIDWLGKQSTHLYERCNLALLPNDPDQSYTAVCTAIEFEFPWPAVGGVVVGAKQVFHRFEFTSGGLLKDVRTWQGPRPLLTPKDIP